VQAEMYVMHKDIEVEDLAAVRAEADGAAVLFYATTCCEADFRTSVEITGTKGSAVWDPTQAVVRVDGAEEVVLSGAADRDAVHKNLCACIRGEETALLAPASEGLQATQFINCAYVSAGDVHRVPWEAVRNLRSFIDSASDERRLFSEMPDWPKAGRRVPAAEVTGFAGF
jgi:hypothetical protein